MSQQPGRFWHLRQRLVAIGKTFKNPADQKKAKKALRSTALSGLGAGATYTIAATPSLMVATLFAGPFVAGGATLVFGLMAFRNWQEVNRSLTVVRHMNEAKQAWVDKKSRPSLRKRIGASVGNALAATGRVLTAPLRWRPFGKKSAGETSQTVRQLESSSSFDGGASIAPELNEAAKAAAAKRAEARAIRRQQQPGHQP